MLLDNVFVLEDFLPAVKKNNLLKINRLYRRTFIPLSVSLWNALVDPVFDGVGLAGFKTRSNAFLLA